MIDFSQEELKFIRGAVVDAKQFLVKTNETANGHYQTILNVNHFINIACSILDKIDNKDLQSSGHNYK